MKGALETQVQRIEVSGTRLAYVETGAGKPVVFVHGVLNDCPSGASRSDRLSVA